MKIKSIRDNLKVKDKVLVVLLLFFVICMSILCWFTSIQLIFLPTLGVLLILIISIQLNEARRRQVGFERLLQLHAQNYARIESLFSIFSTVNMIAPLPPMRGWGISPDFANLIVLLVRQIRPNLILELGSGVSTLIAAYSLKQIGQGQVISIDHDGKFAETTRARLQEHELQDVATIIHAPLTELPLERGKQLWYDLSTLNKENLNVDLLIVDGPPGETCPLARYPALPLLWNCLSDKAVVLLDDFKREDEKKIVELWKYEFNQFTTEVIDTERGSIIMRKSRGTKKPEHSGPYDGNFHHQNLAVHQ